MNVNVNSFYDGTSQKLNETSKNIQTTFHKFEPRDSFSPVRGMVSRFELWDDDFHREFIRKHHKASFKVFCLKTMYIQLTHGAILSRVRSSKQKPLSIIAAETFTHSFAPWPQKQLLWMPDSGSTTTGNLFELP